MEFTSRPIFRIGADSPTSLHPYSNPHRNFHDIQFDRKLLDIQETIGVGEYGQVVRALAFNIDGRYGWTDVAVKNVKADADKHGKEALLAEMSIMRLVEPHNNVVRLLGCCIDADPYFMILEYLPGGNLQDFLRKMGAPSLNPIPMSSQGEFHDQGDAKWIVMRS
jgi:serine/threonine protein kinase